MQNTAQEVSDVFSKDQLTKAQVKQRAKERKAYKTRCTEPTPSHLSVCERLKWELSRNKDCRDMRENFSKKWYGDNDPAHVQEVKNLNASIDRLEKRIARECDD